MQLMENRIVIVVDAQFGLLNLRCQLVHERIAYLSDALTGRVPLIERLRKLGIVRSEDSTMRLASLGRIPIVAALALFNVVEQSLQTVLEFFSMVRGNLMGMSSIAFHACAVIGRDDARDDASGDDPKPKPV
jgi:hypothetical protein